MTAVMVGFTACGIAPNSQPAPTIPGPPVDPKMQAFAQSDCLPQLLEMAPGSEAPIVSLPIDSNRVAFHFEVAGESADVVVARMGGRLVCEAGAAGSTEFLDGPISVGSIARAGGGAWIASGVVPVETASVIIELRDGKQVVGSARSGRFVAWWGGERSLASLKALRGDGGVIAETSDAGDLMNP